MHFLHMFNLIYIGWSEHSIITHLMIQDIGRHYCKTLNIILIIYVWRQQIICSMNQVAHHLSHSCQHTFSYCTFRMNTSTAVQVEVSFDKLATDRLELWYLYCFELGCLTTNSSMFLWMEGTAMKVDGDSIMVELPYCPSGATATTIRYCWRTDPCSFMKCPYTVAIYQPRPSLWTLIRAAAKFDS